jgi:hypothetical protein
MAKKKTTPPPKKKPISKAVSDAAKDLQNPKSSKKLKEDAGLALGEHGRILKLEKKVSKKKGK